MSGVNLRRVEVAQQMRGLLGERPRSVYELLREFDQDDYRLLLQAWGDVRAQVAVRCDNRGRYRLPETL